MVQRCRFNFMREAQIWYSRDHADQRTLSPKVHGADIFAGYRA
jgi:hypothetical protein